MTIAPSVVSKIVYPSAEHTDLRLGITYITLDDCFCAGHTDSIGIREPPHWLGSHIPIILIIPFFAARSLISATQSSRLDQLAHDFVILYQACSTLFTISFTEMQRTPSPVWISICLKILRTARDLPRLVEPAVPDYLTLAIARLDKGSALRYTQQLRSIPIHNQRLHRRIRALITIRTSNQSLFHQTELRTY